jgi:hypothetical protein
MTEYQPPQIAEGEWFELVDNGLAGKAVPCTKSVNVFVICGFRYLRDGAPCLGSPRKIRRIWPVPTNPAEVVVDLRQMAAEVGAAAPRTAARKATVTALDEAADLVAKRLGVEC